MHKGNTGYLLLFILVVTGLAGRYSSDTITAKERSVLQNQLKITEKDFIKNINGLSEAQLNFKSSADKWSIKEYVYHLTLSEASLRKKAEVILLAEANPEKRDDINIKDKDIIESKEKVSSENCVKPDKAVFKNTYEAINAFEKNRSSLIKYTQTTTENLRNHVGNTQYGAIDGYQMLLMISAHTRLHTKQIKKIKADPAFPHK